jgi:hypothetical protein
MGAKVGLVVADGLAEGEAVDAAWWLAVHDITSSIGTRATLRAA